ncbi:hypothetical protein MA13_contig00013-0041 [Edwardsiella piscicida]|nr:hypothetical protein MA13_contig00013-0041 [Edwardsiella piscicida]
MAVPGGAFRARNVIDQVALQRDKVFFYDHAVLTEPPENRLRALLSAIPIRRGLVG